MQSKTVITGPQIITKQNCESSVLSTNKPQNDTNPCTFILRTTILTCRHKDKETYSVSLGPFAFTAVSTHKLSPLNRGKMNWEKSMNKTILCGTNVSAHSVCALLQKIPHHHAKGHPHKTPTSSQKSPSKREDASQISE